MSARTRNYTVHVSYMVNDGIRWSCPNERGEEQPHTSGTDQVFRLEFSRYQIPTSNIIWMISKTVCSNKESEPLARCSFQLSSFKWTDSTDSNLATKQTYHDIWNLISRACYSASSSPSVALIEDTGPLSGDAIIGCVTSSTPTGLAIMPVCTSSLKLSSRIVTKIQWLTLQGPLIQSFRLYISLRSCWVICPVWPEWCFLGRYRSGRQ